MGAQQAPGRFARFRPYLAAIASTAVGCALIYLGLQQPAASPPTPTVAAPSTHRAGMAVSARGGRPAARPRVAGEQDAPALGSSRATPPSPTPVLLLGALGTNDLPATPPPTASEEAPAPTATEERPPAPTPTLPRTEILVHQVQPGDNLWLISQRFNLSQDTLAWANEEVEQHPDQLKIGQELYILPVDGVWHTVRPGETLAEIAKRYGVDPGQIASYAANGVVDAGSLRVDQKLIIPGGVKPPEPRAAAAAPAKAAAAPDSGKRIMIPAGAPATPVEAPSQPGRFVWPASGTITQWYGKWHGAIDIANKQGTPILAADAGTVTFAGPSGGLGNAVQIDHGDGFATTYAHLHSISVQAGQGVKQGEQIGAMGTTGHSTGPHLHLIVTYNGGIVNPLDYLPQ